MSAFVVLVSRPARFRSARWGASNSEDADAVFDGALHRLRCERRAGLTAEAIAHSDAAPLEAVRGVEAPVARRARELVGGAAALAHRDACARARGRVVAEGREVAARVGAAHRGR